VEDLGDDAAACGVDGFRDRAVWGCVVVGGKAGGAGKDGALGIRGEAAGDDQGAAGARALGVEGGEAGPVAGFFQTRVHRAHDDAVRQGERAEVERAEEVGVAGHGAGALLRAGALPRAATGLLWV
jgi:hypothetical protein